MNIKKKKKNNNMLIFFIREKIFLWDLSRNIKMQKVYSIFHTVKTQKDSRGITFPSFAPTVWLFHCFFLFLHFPSNLSVSRISTEVRALWMARVSSTLLFPFCVFHPALFHVCFQIGAPDPVQRTISNPNCPCRCFVSNDKRAQENLVEYHEVSK